MTDYLQALFAMLGPGEDRYADPAAWLSLEEELGRTFPADYKRIVDAYAPVQIVWPPVHGNAAAIGGRDDGSALFIQ